jgi:hypothetical protein
MSFSPLVAVGTLVFTFVNVLTYIRSKNLNGVVTQAIAWVAGIVAILIAAHTQFAPQISFGSQKLSQMDWQTQVFLGLIATSILSTVNEVKKAIDTTDSAAKAPLITSTKAPAKAVPAVGGGVADLVNGSVTVANQAVVATNSILVTPQTDTVTGSLRVSIPRAGSFTISSTNPADNGPVAYQIV